MKFLGNILMIIYLLNTEPCLQMVGSASHDGLIHSSDETIAANFTVMYKKHVQHAKSITFVFKDHSVMVSAFFTLENIGSTVITYVPSDSGFNCTCIEKKTSHISGFVVSQFRDISGLFT